MAISHITLLKYNNYFNRIVRTEPDYPSYLQYIIGEPIYNVNFNPNDGVDTELVINWNSETADYLLVTTNPIEGIEYPIVSRWFIIDSTRLRSGQYKLTLHRDVLADYIDEVKQSPCYIKKGYIPKNNPLIFNNEGFKFNQIKKQEIAIKDKTQCGWIVGYMDPTYPTKNEIIDGISSQEYIPPISEFAYNDLVGKKLNGDIIKNKTGYAMFITSTYPKNDLSTGHPFCKLVNNFQDGSKESAPAPRGEFNLDIGGTGWLGEVYTNSGSRAAASQAIDLMDSRIKTYNMIVDDQAYYKLYSNTPNRDIHDIINTNGNVYRKEDGTFVKVVISNLSTEKMDVAVLRNNYAASFDYFNNALKSFANYYGYQLPYAPNTFYNVHIEYQTINISLVQVENPNATIKINMSANANILKDAPYKMFCIPYDTNIKTSVSSDDIFTMNKEYSLNVASAIINSLQPAPSGHIYDVQLLPYCPIEGWFETVPDVNVLTLKSNYREKIDYDYIKDASGNNSGIIFYPTKSSFTSNIPLSIKVPTDSIDFKVERETSLFRLCSPNYSNFEDFDPYMNNGVDLINIDCTYKPFTPYIKLNINFKNLYGDDFNDARGLICGGDYSLPMMSDAFRQYEIQNKNYANIFERELDNMDVIHKYDMVGKRVNAIAGTVTGAAIGSYFGGLGGGLIGGTASALGGLADIGIAQELYRENKDFKQDIYEYQLQNIQAKPKGLVKTSAFNYNSRIQPFLEVYSCTDTEKKLLRNTIKYMGMTVNSIGTIPEFLGRDNTYIEGEIIRMENIKDDYHLVNSINNELKKGVYM